MLQPAQPALMACTVTAGGAAGLAESLCMGLGSIAVQGRGFIIRATEGYLAAFLRAPRAGSGALWRPVRRRHAGSGRRRQVRAIAAVALGRVHGGVGASDQGAGIVPIAG